MHFSWLLAFSLFLLSASVAQSQGEWSKDVKYVFVRTKDRKTLPVPQNEVVFTNHQVRLKVNDNIETLLSSAGIYPDAESFGLVYRLNPGLASLNLTPDSMLFLPKVDGGASIRDALKEGYLAALTTDASIKTELTDITKSIEGSLKQDIPFQKKHFSTASGRDETVKASDDIKNLLTTLNIITKGRSRPIDSTMLSQVLGEAKLYKAIALDKQSLNMDDIRRIKLIAENMRIRSLSFGETMGAGQLPQPYPYEVIRVKVKNKAGTEVPNFRVYYIPEALYGIGSAPGPLTKLSSPAEGKLPVADYMIWAGQPGNSQELSDVIPVKIRKQGNGQPLEVELVIQK